MTQYSLRFDTQSETVDRRLAHSISQDVDRVPFLVQPLHDAERAAVDSRAKEACDGGIAQVLDRNREWRELFLSITGKARIEKLKADQLLALTGANPNRTLAQLVHEVDVGQLQ